MKKTISCATAALLTAVLFYCFSCNGTKNDKNDDTAAANSKETSGSVNDDELKGFLLGGIYFINGYGGKSSFQDALTTNGTGKTDIVSSAKELMIYPFKQTDSSDVKRTLSGMWDVKSKDDLLKTLDQLKNHTMESSYTKAWDYARYVNNICLGYAAGYLTQDEGKKLVADVLPLAQKDYKNWKDYFIDFGEGRNKWNNEESEDKKNFDALSKTITDGDNNIYSIIPLN